MYRAILGGADMAASLPPGVVVEEQSPVELEGPVRVEECWDEPSAAEDRVPTDLQDLQGAWVAVVGRRGADFLIAGKRFAVRFWDGAVYMGTFELDPVARPKTMDMRIEEGLEHHKGMTALCIYDLEGDTLRWCASGLERPERPGGFAAESDGRYLSLLLRRAERR
jgi:uncharacterized protein (TIGR03067 family)